MVFIPVVAVAWMFVVVLMAAAEALSPQGSVLGAFFTLLLYGLLPLSVLVYIMATPLRRRARRMAEAASAAQPDGGGHAAGDPVAAEREKA